MGVCVRVLRIELYWIVNKQLTRQVAFFAALTIFKNWKWKKSFDDRFSENKMCVLSVEGKKVKPGSLVAVSGGLWPLAAVAGGFPSWLLLWAWKLSLNVGIKTWRQSHDALWEQIQLKSKMKPSESNFLIWVNLNPKNTLETALAIYKSFISLISGCCYQQQTWNVVSQPKFGKLALTVSFYS